MTTPPLSAHAINRAKTNHRPAATRKRARNGTPGWVAWCVEFTYPPRTDLQQAIADLRMAESHGCPHFHVLRDVLIAKDGKRFRYVNREELAG